MTSSAPGIRWIGHPLLNAFAAKNQLTVYVRFTVLDKGSNQPLPIPAGIDVSLMDGSQPLDTKPTDSNGVANLNVVFLTQHFPDMYFVVNTSQIQAPFAGRQPFPAEWSTKGWLSSDGLEFGYHEHFTRANFGTSANPIEFEIGVSFFLNIVVESTTETGNVMPLPSNTNVELSTGSFLNPISINSKVDEFGVATYFSFAVQPGSDVTLKIKALTDSDGTALPFLQGVFVDNWYNNPTSPSPLEFTIDAAQTNLANIAMTSIGFAPGIGSGPRKIKLTASSNRKLCAAFTCLKNLTELNYLVRCVAPYPDWNDYAGMHINIGFINGGLSWPINVINLSMSLTADRSLQIHEFSHQLLWRWGNYSTQSIFGTYCRGDAFVKHNWNYLINPEHALLEGWATIFEMLAYSNRVSLTRNAAGAKITVDNYSCDIIYGSINPLATPTILVPASQLTTNWGESVEGAFAAAMFNLFKEYVLPGTPPSTGSLIPPSPNGDGDITRSAHLKWLTGNGQSDSDARARFKNTFVEPVKALSNMNAATTTDFIDAIRAINSLDWNTIKPILQNYFLAFPQVEYVLATGSQDDPAVPGKIVSTGGSLDIVGRHFVSDPGTKVYVDATLAPSTFQSSRKITCLAPARPSGSIVDVMLLTPDGDDILVGGLEYV
jgi:IPT/TIG domain